MVKNINIIDSPKYVDQKVEIGVWLTDKRSSGKISFLQLRDGTAFFQGIVIKDEVGDELYHLVRNLKQETSLIVTGIIHEDKRSHFGYEISISNIQIIGESHDFPITPKEHGIEFLLDNRHLWLRSKKPFAIMHIRNELIKLTYDFFYKEGFIKLDPPLITDSAAEGTTELFHIDYFHKNAYLSQTGQLYEEAGAMAFGKVFSFGPVFRAEKSKTRRHLTEFWMIEPEMAFYHQEDSLVLQEQYISFLIENVLDKCKYDFKLLDRNIDILKKCIELPYPRITYDDAIKLLQNNGFKIQWGEDFGSPEETFISNKFDKPVFVLNYPKKVKAFYMKPHPIRDDVVICADLLAPEGYGEIIGGSERATDFDYLKKQIIDNNLNIDDYKWYLDLRKYGSVPHSGFGLGLERLIAWICHLSHLREAIPFPRMINRMTP